MTTIRWRFPILHGVCALRSFLLTYSIFHSFIFRSFIFLAESNPKLSLQTRYTLIFKIDMCQKVCFDSLVKSLKVNRIPVGSTMTITNQGITPFTVYVLLVLPSFILLSLEFNLLSSQKQWLQISFSSIR